MGISLGLTKNCFLWVTLSEITAATVVSEPDPDVVGTTKKGSGGVLIFKLPTSLLSGTFAV